MESDEKTCPKCAETVKAAAVACKHCGHSFKRRDYLFLLPAVALAAIVLGIFVVASYMGYQEYEEQQFAERAAEIYALRGAGANHSAEAVHAQVDALSEMDGVTKDMTEKLVEFDASHAKSGE